MLFVYAIVLVMFFCRHVYTTHSLPEIPLFHVLNARVTFSNLCGCDEPVSSVTVHKPESSGEAGNYSRSRLKQTKFGCYYFIP